MAGKLSNVVYASLIFSFLLFSFSACRSLPTGAASEHLRKAEELSRMGEYDPAIEQYKKHMRERLSSAKRAEWENPYFYLILIGDIELGRNEPDKALKNYLEAEEHKVDPYLVSDRIRSVARWYEKRANLNAAIELLDKYRAKDPIIFESILDRLAKELVEREQFKSEL